MCSSGEESCDDWRAGRAAIVPCNADTDSGNDNWAGGVRRLQRTISDAQVEPAPALTLFDETPKVDVAVTNFSQHLFIIMRPWEPASSVARRQQ